MFWMFKLPAYRTAVVERTLGILIFSPEHGLLIDNDEARGVIRSSCALGFSVDRTALMLVMDVLFKWVHHDMSKADVERVLVGLLTWPDHTTRDHQELRNRVLNGDLGPDPVLTRFRHVCSYIDAAETLGGITAQESKSFASGILTMLEQKLPDKLALKNAIEKRKISLQARTAG